MLTLALEERELRCSCGARSDIPNTRCRKCRARSRWHRRKTWHTKRNIGRRLHGKK
jgi:ribosomal protein L40E